MPSVDCVYVGSCFKPDLPDIVRNALKKIGDENNIKVEELHFSGYRETQRLSEECIRKIPDIEFMFSDPSLVGQIFCHPQSRLKWAQTLSAGCDLFFKELQKTQRKPDFILTRRDDDYPTKMGEYVIGQIISRERRFPIMNQLQTQSKFDGQAVKDYRSLKDLTVGLIGLGNIGSEVARMCRAMKMTVLGVVRDERYTVDGTTCEHLDDIRPLSQLSSVLESCDYFVSVLPSTPQTINLLSGDVLKSCQKKSTVLINVGRGSLIDDDSLINAVKRGWIGGAILDVFNKEPLPPSSLLWNLPGVIITPHVSSISSEETVADSFLYNLNAYRNGTPMKNIVDFNKGY